MRNLFHFTTKRFGSLVSFAAVGFVLLLNINITAQGSYVDPTFGAGDAIARSDVFVADRQGRVPAKEGMFTKQMSGWLGGSEVMQGEVVHVGRGCPAAGAIPVDDPYLNDPAGKIALIARGDCTFALKINRAFKAGAIGVIAYNNVAGGENLVTMGPYTPGSISIPAFFVARSVGLTLAATPVYVKVQAASFRALKDAVAALQKDGSLTRRQAGALKDKVAAAEAAAFAGDYGAATELVENFQADYTVLSTGGFISAPDKAALDQAATILIERLKPYFTENQ